MKKLLLLIWVISIVFSGCNKDDFTPDDKDNILSDNTIIVSREAINSSLIAVDSTNLTFTASGPGVDKIKVGSILVSDISPVASIGFLRKVTAITTSGSNKVFTTEQAALTDAIVKGSVKFTRTFSDSDIIGVDSSGVDISAQQRVQRQSFSFIYNEVLYDADGNSSTTYDQIKINGEMKVEPTFDFELDIDGSRVKKFVAKINLKNTNKINAESKVVLASFNNEIVLKTFQLKPFTIPGPLGLPIPIKQWIAIVLGVDGNLSARVTASAQNINTAVAGISYENNSWNTINTQDNSFTLQPLTFEGAARVEPWLQARWELRPYGIKAARIYIGVRGSIIGEASIIPTGLNTTLNWGVKFSAKAQMQIWDRAVLNYEQIFFERKFPIFQSNTIAFPTLTTTSTSNVTQTTAQSGGIISSDGGATVTARGVVWSTSQNPTITSNQGITNNGSGTGSFTSSLIGLTANTLYYVRAYATNSAGTAYGNQVSFTTGQAITLPTLTTTTITAITQTTATGGGNVTATGGATVTARGVCWSTTQNPTTANSRTTDGTGTGSFTSSITGLTANTLYFVRAYATNSAGTAYGSQVSFTTGQQVGPTDVFNPTTGKIWMDRNLGATQVATSSTDANAYGHLYQWGRGTDGHQIRTSGTTTTLSSSNTPGHGNFILAPNSPWDWRSPQNSNLWQGVSGTNNPCPSGYRLPTEAELNAERASWSSNNSAGAFASPLKLPVAGFRSSSGGWLGNGGIVGYYWSSTVSSINSRLLSFGSSNASIDSDVRTPGLSVRCLKD